MSARAEEEQLVDVGRGITLCYQRLGDPAGEPLLLVAGLGQQLHSWPDDFCAALAERGYSIIRFDNRDVGRSTHMSYRPPNPIAMFRGRAPSHHYHLGDMATDAVGLLDALDISSAHIVGVSMGGMIAQTVAAHYHSRVRSLASIMSNTGAARIGRPSRETWIKMLGRPPRDRTEAMDRAERFFQHIGSQGMQQDRTWLREYAGLAWDRDHAPEGVVRQLSGIFATGDRTAEIGKIAVPTVVIHGDRDPMVNPTGGAATAAAIPGAKLETIVGMGHDLPPAAWTRIIDLIDANARAALVEPDPALEPLNESVDEPTDPVAVG